MSGGMLEWDALSTQLESKLAESIGSTRLTLLGFAHLQQVAEEVGADSAVHAGLEEQIRAIRERLVRLQWLAMGFGCYPPFDGTVSLKVTKETAVPQVMPVEPVGTEVVRVATAPTLPWTPRPLPELDRLHQLLAREGFGTEKDAEELQAAVCDCLRSGLPPTDKRLRDRLLEWDFLLDPERDDVARLCAAIGEEQRRREMRRRVEKGKPGSGVKSLTPELEAQRQEIVGVTRGATGLMVGGIPRPDNGDEIEESLELDRFEWVRLEPNDHSLKRVLNKLCSADVVFINRFNHTQHSQMVEHAARKQGRILIHLTHGYGLNQVIAQTHEQMFRRTLAAA